MKVREDRQGEHLMMGDYVEWKIHEKGFPFCPRGYVIGIENNNGVNVAFTFDNIHRIPSRQLIKIPVATPQAKSGD